MIKKNFFNELKRRNVHKVALTYTLTAWLIAQVASLALSAFEAPDWILQAVLILLVIGFPIALVLSWIFDYGPKGIVKTDSIEEDSAQLLPGAESAFFNIGFVTFLILFIIAQFLYYNVWINDDKERLSSNYSTSLAVLPFTNMTGNDDMGYLYDGIAEGIINSLAEFPKLRVVARTSSFQFRNREEDVREIGESLNAQFVVESSVQLQEDTFLITVQLINASNGYHELSREYFCMLSETHNIKERIADDIIDKLKLEKPIVVRTRYKVNNEAYLLVLKGNKALEQTQFDRMLELYQEAVKVDPNYPEAYAGLCAAYQWLSYTGRVAPSEAFLQAKDWGRRALELDENLPIANALMGIISNQYDMDYRAANRYFDRALAIAPSQSPHALMGKAELFVKKGNIKKADAYVKLILDNDPLSPFPLFWNIQLLRNTGRYSKALSAADEMILLHPGNPMGPIMKAAILTDLDVRPQEAMVLMKSIFHIEYFSGIAHFYVQILINAGEEEEANLLITQLKDREKSGFVSPYTLGYIQFLKGEVDQGFAYFSKAYQMRDLLFLSHMEQEPIFDPYRQDPRYLELLDQMGLGKSLKKSLEEIY